MKAEKLDEEFFLLSIGLRKEQTEGALTTVCDRLTKLLVDAADLVDLLGDSLRAGDLLTFVLQPELVATMNDGWTFIGSQLQLDEHRIVVVPRTQLCSRIGGKVEGVGDGMKQRRLARTRFSTRVVIIPAYQIQSCSVKIDCMSAIERAEVLQRQTAKCYLGH